MLRQINKAKRDAATLSRRQQQHRLQHPDVAHQHEPCEQGNAHDTTNSTRKKHA